MNSTMKLPVAMNNCPTAWVNFFMECCDSGPPDERGDVKIEYIDEQLAPWNARYDDPTDSVVFEDEAALSWFYLKWG